MFQLAQFQQKDINTTTKPLKTKPDNEKPIIKSISKEYSCYMIYNYVT